MVKLARHVSANACTYGVDFVLFEDGTWKIHQMTWNEIAELVRMHGKPMTRETLAGLIDTHVGDDGD